MALGPPAPPERFLALECGREQCIAVYSPAATPRAWAGVVIVVGGPQYRVGSHRQFALLARDLARAGVPALRFDYRGMGDSDGDARTFESIDEDIGAAVLALTREAGIGRIVLWGLCDGASAALMYAAHDTRIVGIVAANPWARTPQGEARTRLRHYYLERIISRHFWRKVLGGRVDLRHKHGDLMETFRNASKSPSPTEGAYLARMMSGWRRFKGSVLFLMSGNDHTAREFEGWVASHPECTRMLRTARAEVHRIEEADHTFSARAWRDAASQATLAWINKLASRATS